MKSGKLLDDEERTIDIPPRPYAFGGDPLKERKPLIFLSVSPPQKGR
jgi:hypothetical protein